MFLEYDLYFFILIQTYNYDELMSPSQTFFESTVEKSS